MHLFVYTYLNICTSMSNYLCTHFLNVIFCRNNELFWMMGIINFIGPHFNNTKTKLYKPIEN